jgi:GTP-binding protein EngB required for normal cell division
LLTPWTFSKIDKQKPKNKPKKSNQMKTTLSTSHAAEILANDENSSFSRLGAYALVEYLEQMEEDCGEEIEFCHVAIRCDYSEYDSLQEWAHEYFSNALQELGFDETEENDDDKVDEKIREYIQDRGQLIEFSGGIIVSSF